MSRKAHWSAIGMMVLVAPLAIAGCLPPEGDELAGDESAMEEALSAMSPVAFAACALPGSVFDQRIEVCQSGWPGGRTCRDSIANPTDVIASSISVAISGFNGEVSHSALLVGTRQIDFSATVREGDLFSPGKNTTTYIVSWCRNPNP